MDIEKPITHSAYVELRSSRDGNPKPYIVGTRTGIDTIYVCHELQGMSPDQILEAYPHLTLSQIHGALAYYFDHADEVRIQIRRDQEFSAELESQQGPTKFTLLRDTLFGVEDDQSDQVSS